MYVCIYVCVGPGVSWMPSGDLLRLVAGLWLLMGMTLCSVYSSNLMAMLISPRLQYPFTTLEELAKTNLITAGIEGMVIVTQIKVSYLGFGGEKQEGCACRQSQKFLS